MIVYTRLLNTTWRSRKRYSTPPLAVHVADVSIQFTPQRQTMNFPTIHEIFTPKCGFLDLRGGVHRQCLGQNFSRMGAQLKNHLGGIDCIETSYRMIPHMTVWKFCHKLLVWGANLFLRVLWSLRCFTRESVLRIDSLDCCGRRSDKLTDTKRYLKVGDTDFFSFHASFLFSCGHATL